MNARAETAIQKSLFKAERLNNGWVEQAHALLRRYCWGRFNAFLTEDFAAFAELHGLPEPLERRAYGGIIRAAAKAGVIRRVGYATDRYCSPKALWTAV